MHLAADRLVEATMLAPHPAEGVHERQVRDDIDHLAVHRGRLARETVMQRLSSGSQAKHHDDPKPRPDHEDACHRYVDGKNEGRGG